MLGDLRALRYDGGKLVPCPNAGMGRPLLVPRPLLDTRPGPLAVLHGHLVAVLAGWAHEQTVILYLPPGEEYVPQRHRADILAALGLCDACLWRHEDHNEEDRAACAEVLRQVAENEAAEVPRG
jgi:hypothetical protein